MARLIDANALIDEIKHTLWDWDSVDGIMSSTVLKQTISDINNMPTIDAVPIVRCKDCRWFNDRLKRDETEDNRYAPSICILYGRPHSNTYFCADGEVKDETY